MERKSLTLKELRKTWWWNDPRCLEELDKKVRWEDVEKSARNYELMRRSPKGKVFTKTYPELTKNERTIVHVLWTYWPKPPYRTVINRQSFEERGWTPVYEYQYRQWNLTVHINHLVEEFVREIKLLRQIHKVSSDKHPLIRQNFRGVSWKAIEFIDYKHNQIGTLNSSQRSQASKAERIAVQFYPKFKGALSKWIAKQKALTEYEASEEDRNTDGMFQSASI